MQAAELLNAIKMAVTAAPRAGNKWNALEELFAQHGFRGNGAINNGGGADRTTRARQLGTSKLHQGHSERGVANHSVFVVGKGSLALFHNDPIEYQHKIEASILAEHPAFNSCLIVVAEQNGKITPTSLLKQTSDQTEIGYEQWWPELPISVVQDTSRSDYPTESAEHNSDSAIEEIPLNQILYGPPGTGKTFSIVDKVLEICDPASLKAQQNAVDRAARKNRFDDLVSAGQVEMVTFHQSYGYEEFVQGIKATTINGNVHYSVEAGVFKRLCQRAEVGPDQRPSSHLKVGDDFNGCKLIALTAELAIFKKRNGKRLPMPREVIDNITELTVKYDLDVSNTSGEELEAFGSIIEPYFVTGYGTIHKNIVTELIARMENTVLGGAIPHVLVIDEINRGNIAKIFGELITLIEPSKRKGNSDGLEVRLPYSDDNDPLFGVPANVYIIGTMNTADRSIALLDTALRRRFEFIETPPNPAVLANLAIVAPNGEKVMIEQLLTAMNARIEALYDKEHRIGHAYFTSLLTAEDTQHSAFVKLSKIMRNRVVPLLQEYFYDDWEKIRLVLGDNKKQEIGSQFVVAERINVHDLFGDTETNWELADLDKRYYINEQAFFNPAAYVQTYR